MKHWMPAALAVVLGLALAVLATTPQPSAPLSADETEFSAARAMEHVRIIAREPHPTGSAENAEVRAYLERQIEALGGEVTLEEASVPERGLEKMERWSGERPEALTLTNVIGVFPGTDPSAEAVALMAHHDTVYGSPGAPDDSAGVAAILETVRAIRASGQAKRDIVILLTDGEELGLLGARHFFAENPLAQRIGAIINLEARGGGGRTTLFQTSADNGAAIEVYAGAVGRPGGSSLATFIYEALPNDTDLTPALELDYAAYNLSFIGRPGQYHSPKATPDALDQGAVQDMGDQSLALTSALANAEALPAPQPNRTFFDLLGLFLIHYGSVAGWLLLGVAAALHLLCLRGNMPGGWWRGLAAGGAVMVGGGVALYLANLLSGAGSGELRYYDRLAAIPMLEGQALMLCVAALVVALPLWAGRAGSILGMLIALAMQIAAPTTAFLVVWPLLLAGIIGVSKRYLPGMSGDALRVVLASVALGMLLQFGHMFMQGVGPDLPSVGVLLAALAIPVLGPLVPPVEAKRAVVVAAICTVAALTIATYVRLDPIAETVPAYRSMRG
ncbi:M20/M25/M40 family metallo-hydrolase [Parerythrobacter lacustris]|uniref:Vacuolar membrane protease n=1 Tax=Parerythrobacter lacustris TaxID=2969984 RepID=A0ABT1XQN3_9SPHN|nr:M20/M25/M40 family metallo-hydrolase [Parerythrobacter lacustris]MCR2833951.1 M20/M25/M40 family metallo-hydrolase [Parerythrobacter lacustris]